MTVLGAVQQRGHGRIDHVYGPLSLAVERDVLRRARGDLLPLSATPAVLYAVGRLLDQTRPALFAAIAQTLQEAALAAQPTDDPLRPATTLALVAGPTRRVIAGTPADRDVVLRQTGALLYRGVVRGLAAGVIAKQARQYFSPFFATRRDANGTLRRDGREGAVNRWPGQAGMASQRPRLVMLTETSAVYNGTMTRVAQRDGELLRYTLALRHADRDLCDEWASVNTGYGPGIYTADDAPAIPNHPRCRCYYEPAGKRPSFPEEQYALTGKRRAFPIRWRP